MVRELKHTEIGDIPVDWELQTFDETFRVISNNTLSRENLNNRGGAVRNIHYGDILTKFPEVLDCNEEEIPYVNELSLLSSSTQLLQDGDIVVADTAEDETVGKVIEVQNLGDSKLVAGLHTIPCRVKKGEFAPGWLGYYMNSDLFHNQILPYITGIKVSSISKGAISETLILVPPFDEQEKIVQSLNKIQLLMTTETKVVNKIKLVKNGCLSKMFPQKDDIVPEMRLPGFNEAWEQRKLKDVVDFLDTMRKPLEGAKRIPGPYPYYGASGIVDYVDGYLFDEELVLLSEDGANITDRNYPVCFLASGKYWVNNHAHVLRTKDGNENNFICNSLERKDYKQYNSGMAMPKLNKEVCQSIPISCPRFDEQKKIGDYFRNLDHIITLHQCKCDKYSNIKKGMMSDLLTGKIRLV